MERARTFDRIASAYDANRSGYPAELFEDVISIAWLRPGNRVLEIGCGSGLATAGFVARGLNVTGVDPGDSLVALARAKFADNEAARFEVATFEDWESDNRRFELVAAAQSWHWVRADKGFAKAADALTPGGFLAIFGHTPAWSDSLMEVLAPLYRDLAPNMTGPPPEAWYLSNGPVRDLMAASGRFAPSQHRAYTWRRAYTAASFAAYLNTRSDHQLLPPARRAALLSAVEAELPASFEADWVTNLYMAPVR